MATAFGSIAHQIKSKGTDDDSLVISKPTDLAAGDLMIAACFASDSDGHNFQPPVGWTELFVTSSSEELDGRVFWKIATSGDASATNFTFTINNSVNNSDAIGGWIMRITGVGFNGAGNIISDFDDDGDFGTALTFTPGITPLTSSSLYILGVYHNSVETVSGYAIASNNPSWTERLDVNVNTTTDGGIAVATATALSASASGDYSLTISGAGARAIGFLIAINENVSVNPTPAVITAQFSVQAPTVVGSANATPAVITATFTIPTPTVSTPDPVWNYPSKSPGSWTYPSKS